MASESAEDDGIVEPPKKVAAGRMGQCEICKEADAKYRCPGCGVTFCSVACSRKHKEESGCSGKRDRTAFVALGEITDTVLASDYVLLEDSQRRKDAGYRTLNNISSSKHPPAALKLVKQAEKRGVCLTLMAEGMSRRRTNTTTINARSHSISWKIDFMFSSGTCYTIDRVNENNTLQHAYDVQLCSDSARRLALTKEHAFSTPTADLVFLMVDPHTPKHDRKYFELNSSVPLRQALAGTHILENPQILIVSPDESSNYTRTPFAPAPLVAPSTEADGGDDSKSNQQSDPSHQTQQRSSEESSSSSASGSNRTGRTKVSCEGTPTSSMITSVRVPWTGGVIHALHVAANTATPRFVAVFVHGADREFQNAEHWRSHLPALATAFPDAEYYAVDLPGHGHSEPGVHAPQPPSDAEEVQSLSTFLSQVHHHRPLVLFGRSKGGRQVFQAMQQADSAVQEALAAYVLIAPAVNKPFMDLLTPRVRNTRSLLFWAVDDPVIPYATHQALLDSMPNITFHSFGSVLKEGESAKWKAHCAENERPKDFHETTISFLRNVFP